METFSALPVICVGNSPAPGEFPAQRPVTRSFDVFFDLRLNKRLSKQSWGWWFETLSGPLWRHNNAENTQRYKTRPPSLDFWIDNLHTAMDFIHLICRFCQFHDNYSSVIISTEPQCLTFQQRMMGNFIVFCWSLILTIISGWKATGPFYNCGPAQVPDKPALASTTSPDILHKS